MEEVFDFLKELNRNNNRTWFHDNKDKYQRAKKGFENFINQLIPDIGRFDPDIVGIEAKDCIFRIYRDTRFSHDKTPYKNHMGAFIVKGGKMNPRGGYYVHIEPGESLFAGGIWNLETSLLKALRKDIYDNMEEFKSIVEDPAFSKHYRMSREEMLKKVPSPFPADCPDGEWLKFKKYVVLNNVPDSFFTGDDVLERSIERLKLLFPLNRFLNYTIDEI